MSKIDTLENYISQCDYVLDSGDANKAYKLIIQIVSIYFIEIPYIKSHLNTYSSDLYDEDCTDADYLEDVEILKGKLINHRDNIEAQKQNEEIKKHILPSTININNTNSQTQVQTQITSIDIVLDALRAEFSDDQIKELKELCKRKESKGNILKKIADWGVNTASIVGNILTNPKFWELLDTIPH